MNKDYYKILGVERSASEEDIKRAYHKLAHQHHPDKNGGNADKFKQINEAYQILSNKEKRAQYDRFGSGSPFDGFSFEFGFDPGNLSDLGDVNDIFEAFFDGLGLRRKRKTYEHGADLEMSLEITLEEAFRGARKTLAVDAYINCAKCNGHGYFEKDGVSACSACNGQGEIRESRKSFFGSFNQIKSCDKCSGVGRIPNKPCASCRGEGRTKKEGTIEVNIVPGIESGQIIKIAKAGDVGLHGGLAGDLYVRIKIKPHSYFVRNGNNLHVKEEVGLLGLLLGKKLEIKTIGGNVLKLEISSNANLNEDLRVVGEGMPRLASSGRGDLFVKLIIKQPKKLSKEAKDFLERLGGEIL